MACTGKTRLASRYIIVARGTAARLWGSLVIAVHALGRLVCPAASRQRTHDRVPSLAQRIQSIRCLQDAADECLGIEFQCLGDVALRAEGSPDR
jgi:hypothetical protein